MSVFTAPFGSIRITQHLDYDGTIELDGRQRLGFSPRYPGIVELHEEMPAQTVPLHWHKGAEIIYARHGRARVFVDGCNVRISEGQFCLISPLSRHAVFPLPREDGQSVLSITFDDQYISRLAHGLHDRCLNGSHPIGRGTPYPDQEMEDTCESLIDTLADGASELRFIRATRLLLELLEHVYTRYGAESCELSGTASSERTDSKIKAMIDYFDHNYALGVTVSQAAREFGYTTEYFSRMFASHAGMSPKRYLTEVRLQSAVDELISTRETCGQVARNNGFRSARAFSEAFSKRYGMTPSAFRKAHQNREEQVIKP